MFSRNTLLCCLIDYIVAVVTNRLCRLPFRYEIYDINLVEYEYDTCFIVHTYMVIILPSITDKKRPVGLIYNVRFQCHFKSCQQKVYKKYIFHFFWKHQTCSYICYAIQTKTEFHRSDSVRKHCSWKPELTFDKVNTAMILFWCIHDILTYLVDVRSDSLSWTVVTLSARPHKWPLTSCPARAPGKPRRAIKVMRLLRWSTCKYR